jgi:hypothetical protein
MSPAHYGQQPASASALPAIYADDDAFQLPGAFNPFLSPRHLSPLPSQWAGSPFQEGGDVIRWSGIDLLTQFPPSTCPEPQWSFPWPSPSGSSVSFGPPACVDGCTSHSDEAHAAMRLLQSPEVMRDPFLSDGWQPDSNIAPESWFSLPDGQVSPGGSPWPAAASPVQGRLSLPTTGPTEQNPDLLKICR